jgi:hypothetical protein
MKTWKLLLLSVALLSSPWLRSSAAAPASNAPTLYEVEVVIFRTSAVPADEDWSAPVTGHGFGNGANRGGTPPSIVRMLAAGDYRLGNIEGGLRSSGAWHPLAHAAWVQTAANWGTHAGFSLADLGIDVPGLSGTVYLERAPIYMHLGFDVQYQGAATYTINEMRSVKYNDKQYFDHPAFGIIAVVTPIRHPDTAEH